MRRGVYCRGQRVLNLAYNNDVQLSVNPFIKKLTFLEYDKKLALSTDTANTFNLLINHKQISIELINGAFIYHHLAMPLVDMTAFYTLNEIRSQTLQIMTEIKHNTEKEI